MAQICSAERDFLMYHTPTSLRSIYGKEFLNQTITFDLQVKQEDIVDHVSQDKLTFLLHLT